MNAHIQWVAYKTIVVKEITRFMRIWRQTLLPPIITQSLYFVIFGGFIGSQVKQIDGVPYMSFIVPGLVMMAVINGAFANVSSSFFGSKFQKNIEEILVAPVHEAVVLAGFVTGGMIRGFMTGILVFIVSLIFVRPAVHNVSAIILFSFFTALVFSLGGLLNGLWAQNFDDVSTFTTFILVPLTYLGGVFYPISSLPPIWRNISYLNPIVYMVEGFRSGFIDNGSPAWIGALILLVLSAVLSIFTYWLLRKGKGLRT
ncbi:MAG: ABC transporter permease [Patescibacteria group bacterium]